MSSKIKALWVPILASTLGLSFGYLLGFRQKTVDVAISKAVENEQMRFADEGMLRSKTNYQRPGITQEQVDQIKAISDDYGIPEPLLYAMYKTEKGRMGLYLGANYVDPEIRQRYPPLMWQFAKGAKTWNQHLNKQVMFDPYMNRRTLWSFAKQWNPDPDKWTSYVLENLDFAQRKGLEVTEPPKPKPKPVSVKKDGGRTPKANGSAKKSPKKKEHQ
jgi:hypothetical protein